MFPDFNRWSLPLLILVLQSSIFMGLLFYRFYRKKTYSDLFLGLVLFLTSYSQICYTVGFMGWYNVFRNTKINYFLIDIGLAIAPVIYLYVRSITQTQFKFQKRHLFHFVPAFLIICYRLVIYTYDSLQPNFENTQNGILKIELDEAYVQTIMGYIETPFILVYLAFSLQLFFTYRNKIKEYFSNTYRLELNWLLTFLILFSVLFVYSTIQDILGSQFIELNYEQRWWLNLLVAIITLYVGIKGYYTDTSKLNNLNFHFSPQVLDIKMAQDELKDDQENNEHAADLGKLQTIMEKEAVYLNPELNLADLAKKMELNRGQLSDLINSHFNKNFNDFINGYRVEAVKKMLQQDKHKELSLLGIAEECGFNSKATFNRVFKKFTQYTPSQFLKINTTSEEG